MTNPAKMPNSLAATPGWDDVPQWEKTTPLLGGPGGEMNAQAQSLANRLEYLGTDQGAEKIGFLRSAAGAVKAALSQWLGWQRVSVIDFMTEAQRADLMQASPVLDHYPAFAAFFAHLSLTKRPGVVPGYVYNVGTPLDHLAGVVVHYERGAVLKVTGTQSPAVRLRKGVQITGKVEVQIANAAWDGDCFLLSGADKFGETIPTYVEALRGVGIDDSKGVGLAMRAVNAGEFISFVRIGNTSFTNLRDEGVIDCGSVGSSDPATWHWINSNVIGMMTNLYCRNMLRIIGTTGFPAEVAANQISMHVQPGVNSPGAMRITGASNNRITCQIWDWNIGTLGSPIVFDGGAQWNNVYTNIDAAQITGASTNKVFDLTGTESGQRIFLGPLSFLGRVFFGKAGVNGQYGITWWPDAANNAAFNALNDGTNFNFGVGSDPYAPTRIVWRASGGGNFVLLPKNSATPSANGDMLFELTTDTTLKVKVKGSDGVVRSVTLTLA